MSDTDAALINHDNAIGEGGPRKAMQPRHDQLHTQQCRHLLRQPGYDDASMGRWVCIDATLAFVEGNDRTLMGLRIGKDGAIRL